MFMNISEKDVLDVRIASDPIIIKSAGSMSIEKKASRLAPIPSKLLPVSSAEITIKNFPSARVYTKKTKSH